MTMRKMMAAATIGAISKAISIVIVATILPTSLGFSSAPSRTRIKVKDTKVAVDGTATAVIVPPQNHRTLITHNTTLTNYMQLPVEQYVLIPMPLGSSLTRIDTNDMNFPSKSDDTKFELAVPAVNFGFNLSLKPVIYASVQPHENRVVISSTKALLRGSPFIEKVQLNDRFDFTVTTTLTWKDASSQIHLEQNGNQNGNANKFEDKHPMDCSIRAETVIDVDVSVPFPFSTIPKRALEQTANAVMRMSLKYIQANFVENLAKDYKKWARDGKYRNYRASLGDTTLVNRHV